MLTIWTIDMPDPFQYRNLNPDDSQKRRDQFTRFYNQFNDIQGKIDPEVTIGELKESIDELVRYLKPYSGNLLTGKSAVDAYEKLISERLK